jgi:hypothetical protein
MKRRAIFGDSCRSCSWHWRWRWPAPNRGQETEITREAFTACDGTVASIAKQRYPNRHPRSSGERKAALMRRARAGGTRAGGRYREEESEASAAGRRARDAPLEIDIREKPEPGEETGPSRQAARHHSRAPAEPRSGRSRLSRRGPRRARDSNDSGLSRMMGPLDRPRSSSRSWAPAPVRQQETRREPGRHRLGLLGLAAPHRCGADRPRGRVRPARSADRFRDRHQNTDNQVMPRQRRADDHRRDQLPTLRV